MGHFRNLLKRYRHLLSHLRGLLKGGAFRSVDDDLKFRLIVERKHLKDDHSQGNHRHRSQQEPDNTHQEHGSPLDTLDQRVHDLVVKAGQKIVALFLVVPAVFENSQRGPGDNREGYNHGVKHSGRGPQGNG